MKIQYMAYGSCVIAMIAWVLSSLSNRKKFRCISCPNMTQVAIPLQIMQILVKVILAAAFMQLGLYTMQEFKPESIKNQIQYQTMYMVALYKGFRRSFVMPFACSFELSIALFFYQGSATDGILMTCMVHFGLQRLWVLINKLVYVTVSFITAFKNTK